MSSLRGHPLTWSLTCCLLCLSQLLDDSRFASLFNDPDFQIERDSEEYRAVHPHAGVQAATKAAKTALISKDLAADGSNSESNADLGESDDDDANAVSMQVPEDPRLSTIRSLPQSRRVKSVGKGSSSGHIESNGHDGAGGTSVDSSSGRMIGLSRDILKGSLGTSAASSTLPASASFGDRLATVTQGAASETGHISGSCESSFIPRTPLPSDVKSRGKGKGRGKGNAGQAHGQTRLGHVAADGTTERRRMEHGMLGPAKGKGGKGGRRGRGQDGRRRP